MRKVGVVAVSLVFLMTLAGLSSAAVPRFVKAAVSDLNGDGKAEKVILATIKDDPTFTLTIDGFKTKGELGPEIDGFQIVDLDTRDRYKEVAVHSPGASDDDMYAVYEYDGKSVKLMGHLSRWPTFVGNGIVYVRDWKGFWKKTDVYQLSRSRELKLVPQEVYYVGKMATVGKTFPIYRTKEMKEVVAQLVPKSKVTILLWSQGPSHYEDRYMVKTDRCLLGWMTMKSVQSSLTGINYAD